MILNSSQVGESVWMCGSHPAPPCCYEENILSPLFWLKTAVTADSKANTWKNFCSDFLPFYRAKRKSSLLQKGTEITLAHTNTQQDSQTSPKYTEISHHLKRGAGVIHGRKITCQQARPLNPRREKPRNLLHYIPREWQNNSQKSSWKSKGLTLRTKLILVLYWFLRGGVNGITGPIKLWCRGKRRFLCVCVCVCVCLLTMEMEVSPFVCVSVSVYVYVYVVKQGARQHLCFWAWGRLSG